MKSNLLFKPFMLIAILFMAGMAQAQDLANDQNPRYLESQAKYLQMADSINTLHSTTPQETYKAIDYLADKREARDARRAFRRELRMERARYGYGYDYYYNDYYTPYNNGYYYNRPYRSYYRYNRYNNYYRNTLPLAITLGWWCL